ncbi:MAG: hypothetical protein ACRCWI_03670 [Brevinema sp.]
MKRICYIIVILGCFQIAWGVNPKIAQPLEQAVIKKEALFLFVEPTPQDVEENRYLFIEIFDRNTGRRITHKTLSPSKNYQTSFKIKSWTNGKYLLKVMYVDSEGRQLTKSSWRNFSIQH